MSVSYDTVLNRLSALERELVKLSAECGSGSRGRVAMKCLCRAITEVVMAKTHVSAQIELDKSEWSNQL